VSYRSQDTKISKEQHNKELKLQTKSDAGNSNKALPEDRTNVPTKSGLDNAPAQKMEKVVSTSKTRYVWKPTGRDSSKSPIKASVNTTKTTTMELVSPKGSKMRLDTSHEGDEKQKIELTEQQYELPLQDWNYEKIRDLLSELNEALYLYASNLTKNIMRGKSYKQKQNECVIKYHRLFAEYKEASQDKIKLQELFGDLSSKYTAMEEVLLKVKDINEDNRQLIDKLRANRDHCIQAKADKTKTIYSLRDQTALLRGKLAKFNRRK